MTARGCALLIVSLAAGCSAKPMQTPGCHRDDECGSSDLACVGGSCIPRATPPGTWGVVLDPPSDSTAALTEYNAVSFGGGPLHLSAERRVSVTATLVPDVANAAVATSAHVVLTVPALIPGRPDLQFETDLSASGPLIFSLLVPQGTLGRMATIQLLPTAPFNATHAPVTLQATLAATMQLAIPSQFYTVTGRLFDAIGDPQSGYVARVLRGGQLVSNVDVTINDGAFALNVPVATVARDPVTPFTVELQPDPTTSAPRYTSKRFNLTGALDLGTLNLPAFVAQPQVYRFVVRGAMDGGPGVDGAIVRAQTVLGQDASGAITDFLRDATTDSNGRVDLALLPGTTVSSRPYAVTVIPPAGAPFGALCLGSVPLAAGGTANAPANVQPIVLPQRPTLAGTVSAADGSPVAGATVSAARAPSSAAATCAESAGAPLASVTTDRNGSFTLLVDPGTYRLDYDPPAGSPVPRLTEAGVLVTADATRPVALPSGALVEGDAFEADATTPLSSAAVRLYEQGCAFAAGCTDGMHPEPLLRSQTRAGSSGHFRAVIPLPP